VGTDAAAGQLGDATVGAGRRGSATARSASDGCPNDQVWIARPVRPGKAGPKGVRGAIILMKFGLLSSGCEPRPAKGEPAQPVASLATVAVTRPAMRRHASEWAVGNAATKTMSSRVPRALDAPKATAVSPNLGEGRLHPAGCTTTARSKRTVQAPGRPSFLLGKYRSDGDPVIPLRRAARLRMRARPADATQVAPHRRSIRAEVGRRQGETGAAADGSEGVGGLNTSEDVGERGGARTRPSKGGPC
jgi:hypothetical protein